MKHLKNQWDQEQKVPCPDCGRLKKPSAAKCRKCCGMRGSDSPRFGDGKSTDKRGYVSVTGHPDHPNTLKNGKIYEHTLVMSEHLGRHLVKGENVHHLNGIKDDNGIANLELWYVSQAPGQRVTDLIAYLESTGYEVRKR